MNRNTHRTSLLSDTSGGTLVEFALLAPVFITMMIGVLSVGIQMRDYNMLRSVAADVSRAAMVEYQRSNELDAEQIETMAASRAQEPPYGFSGDQLDVVVVDATSVVAGARKLQVQFTYQPITVLNAFGLSAPQLRYTQSIYVPAT